MSNGDEVVDNWEEIDEAGLTNKVEKIHAERKSLDLQKQQPKLLNLSIASSNTTTPVINSPTNSLQPSTFNTMKLLQNTQSPEAARNNSSSSANLSSSSARQSPLDSMSASFQPVMMVLHQPVDEYQSANYQSAINLQTVKILRRPTQSSEPRDNGMRPKHPIKTLKQREQEYAEARLRIMGSAKNPEDDLVGSPSVISNVTTTAAPSNATKTNGSPKTFNMPQSIYNNSQKQHTATLTNNYNNSNNIIIYKNQRASNAVNKPMQTWSPIVGGRVSTTAASSAVSRQSPEETVVRPPRGPDGSTGFQMRR